LVKNPWFLDIYSAGCPEQGGWFVDENFINDLIDGTAGGQPDAVHKNRSEK
jgi:hypothetical protein